MLFARVRFFCQLTPRDEPLPAAAYLTGIVSMGVGVRVLAIFGMVTPDGPWAPFARHMMTPPADRYVNIVCAPTGLALGRVKRASELGGALGQGFPGLNDLAAGQSHDEVVYVPPTALGGLYTVGMPNIAITVPPALGSVSDEERRALEQYSAVLTPTDEMAQIFEIEHGVKATACGPSEVAAYLKASRYLPPQ